jgi:hypothetical protein
MHTSASRDRQIAEQMAPRSTAAVRAGGRGIASNRVQRGKSEWKVQSETAFHQANSAPVGV